MSVSGIDFWSERLDLVVFRESGLTFVRVVSLLLGRFAGDNGSCGIISCGIISCVIAELNLITKSFSKSMRPRHLKCFVASFALANVSERQESPSLLPVV